MIICCRIYVYVTCFLKLCNGNTQFLLSYLITNLLTDLHQRQQRIRNCLTSRSTILIHRFKQETWEEDNEKKGMSKQAKGGKKDKVGEGKTERKNRTKDEDVKKNDFKGSFSIVFHKNQLTYCVHATSEVLYIDM